MKIFVVMPLPQGYVDPSFGFEDIRLRLFFRESDAEAYRLELVCEGYDDVVLEEFPVSGSQL